MSRDRARNDSTWSKKSKRQIVEDNGWRFAYLEDAPKGAGWYADDYDYISHELLTVNDESEIELFGFRRFAYCRPTAGTRWEKMSEWDRRWSKYGGDYCFLYDDPIGPFMTLEEAINWLYRVKEYYKGRPDLFSCAIGTYGFTARHSETRRNVLKQEKGSQRLAAKANIRRELKDMEDSDEAE